MIWDWDLWPAMIAYQSRTAVLARLATLTAEVERAMTEIGSRLGVPLEDFIRAVSEMHT